MTRTLRTGFMVAVAAVAGFAAFPAAGGSGAVFRFLRIGEVQPRGWLHAQILMDATNGYGRVLDRLTERIELPVFDAARKTGLIKPKIGEVWWNGETTGNWLDGLIRTAYLSGDAAAKRQADELVARILAMQEPDGYLGTYPKALRYEQPITARNGELWSQACLFRGLLAYHELTGRRDVLEAVERAAKLTISKYGPERPYWKEGSVGGGGGPGHDLMFVDICEWLHRLTGDRSFVVFAQFLYDGYSDLVDIRESDIQVRRLEDMSQLFHGHGAHVMEHLRVPLFVAAATGDAKYRTAASNGVPKTFRHLSAGGACISDEGIGQRDGSAFIGCEYCTMLELLHSLQSGVEKSGLAPLGDRIEALAYNSAEGARQRDGRAIQYCTADNQFSAGPADFHRRGKLSPTHEDVAVCCPVTALKFFPYFVNELWMKAADGSGVAAVAYAPNTLRTSIGGVNVRIDSDTAYPFEDEVRMTVTPEKPVAFSLRLRMPGWRGAMRVEAPGANTSDGDGWRAVTKVWRPGDRVTITFQPEVERRAMADGGVYWTRGPLVYALPIAAERKQVKTYAVAGFADYEYTPAAGAQWEYAAEDGVAGAFRVVRSAGGEQPWTAPPVRLAGRLTSRSTGKTEDVELVPMGASLLRRVTFPEMREIRRIEALAAQLKGPSNLARAATVTAPGSVKGYEPAAMADGLALGFPAHPEAEWAGARAGVGTRVRLLWDAPVKAGCVWLFDRPNPSDHVTGVRIEFSDGTSVDGGALPNDGASPLRLAFPERSIQWMDVVVTSVGPDNRNAGFAEIAVFNRAPAE